MHIKDLKIDTEFRKLIRPLSSEEQSQLESNIGKVMKIIDPIKVWSGTNIILDGHHRYEISKKYNFEYEAMIEEIELQGRDDAKRWIIKNQFGRRNLDFDDKTRCTAALLAMEEGPKQEAVKRVAAATKQSSRQVYRDVETQKILENLPGKVKEKIESKVVESSPHSLKILNELPDPQKIQAFDLIEHASGFDADDGVISVADAVKLVNDKGMSEERTANKKIRDEEKIVEKFLEKIPRIIDDRARYFKDEKLGHKEHCHSAIKHFAKVWRDWER